MVLDAIFNPIFFPVLRLHPFLAITIISFVLSLIMTVAYKYLTDQKLMKSLKDEIKELQQETKTLKDNPKQMLAVQKKAMETNMKYFMQSLKPTLITFIPLILIFAWLQAHMAYYPLVQNTEFSVNLQFDEKAQGFVEYLTAENSSVTLLNAANQTILDKAVKFVFTASAGEYNLTFKYKDEKYVQKVLVVGDKNVRSYEHPVRAVQKNGLLSIVTSNEEIKPHKDVLIIGQIPWIKNFGWLGSYILTSIIFSLVLRKVLNVY